MQLKVRSLPTMMHQKKVYTAGAMGLLVLLGLAAFFLGSGVASAFQARDQSRVLQEELSRLTPGDFLQAGTYRSLESRFVEVERPAGRARTRLGFLSMFTWLPMAGRSIEKADKQLDLAYFLARSGGNLATAYRSSLEFPLDQMGPEEASQKVTGALKQANSRLLLVERDLERTRQLSAELGQLELGDRYALLTDSYLPPIQTITFLSRVSPQIFAESYVLNREISVLEELATDPLQVMANPTGVDESLAIVVASSRKIAAALEAARSSVESGPPDQSPVPSEVLQVIDLMQQSVLLLEHSTSSSRTLLALAQLMEQEGLFSDKFATEARIDLDDAETRLALAQDASVALRARLNTPGNTGLNALSAVLFRYDRGGSSSSEARLDELLERASQSTQFMKAFLGFHGPRTYLLLGQNQQEIRASGGFIGGTVRFTLDDGKLVDLVYHDSTTVDSFPPEYNNNPFPPDPLYWYLWMGRLLFRDANWSPNFPTAAARVADIYQLGQGVPVDGVITFSKSLTVDMVDLLGDVRVPDLPDALTRESAQAHVDGDLPYRCSPRHVSTRGKRCFDEDLFFALRDRLLSPMPSSQRAKIIQLFKAALDQHNILIHVFDPVDGTLLWELGWNGAIRPVDHDYLMVVDSSLPGHTTELVQRNWDYRVSLQLGQSANARLRVRYGHQGPRQKDRVCRQSEPADYDCYWNYFRIYLPTVATNVSSPPVPLHQGSEKLIWGYPDPDSGSSSPSSDVGPARLNEIGGFIAVEPGSVMTIPIEYRLPWKTVRTTAASTFEYRLLVQKQPGIDRDQVSVSVELPPGAELLNTDPKPTSQKGRWLFFDFPLDVDQQVVVGFKTGVGG